jgi:Y-X(10)_GDL-associated radical SAM protein
MEAPALPRVRTDDDFVRHVPVHVVWELTLACNLRCSHCGSRAGKRRPGELSTAECLEVVESLARLGTREITLIGGEAYLRKDWTEIVRAIRSHGIYCAIQTGGWAFTDRRLEQGMEAGLQGVGVSVDGMRELHDRVRGVAGAFDNALSVLRRARDAGLNRSANTQIGAETIPQLRDVMNAVIDAGAQQWQLQLTVAMGNAVDNDGLLLQPYRLAELFPLLAQLADEGAERDFAVLVGNNIGYFGPYEHRLRGVLDPSWHWTGCSAGQTVIGLEADGTVKGCPSLATVGYAGGNVRDLSVEEIWSTSPEIHFGRLRGAEDMWGFCRTCYYADVCRAGCTWTSDSLLGRPGNNPYCHHRVLELGRQGLRERIRKVQEAPHSAFATGRFELVLERVPADGSDVGEPVASTESVGAPRLVPLRPAPGRAERTVPVNPRGASEGAGRVPVQLQVCRACERHVKPHERDCPHCGADLAAASAAYEADRRRRLDIMQQLRDLMSGAAPAAAPAEPTAV